MTYSVSFKNAPLIEINGFGAKPQVVSNVIDHPWKKTLGICFLSNIDSKCFDNALSFVNEAAGQTLCIVGSNTNTNEEAPNGRLEGQEASDKSIALAIKWIGNDKGTKNGVIRQHRDCLTISCMTSSVVLLGKMYGVQWSDPYGKN